VKSQVQWDGHHGTIDTIQQVKRDLGSKAPSAFLPAQAFNPSSVSIGPSLVSNKASGYNMSMPPTPVLPVQVPVPPPQLAAAAAGVLPPSYPLPSVAPTVGTTSLGQFPSFLPAPPLFGAPPPPPPQMQMQQAHGLSGPQEAGFQPPPPAVFNEHVTKKAKIEQGNICSS
jgi:hypothetical protein